MKSFVQVAGIEELGIVSVGSITSEILLSCIFQVYLLLGQQFGIRRFHRRDQYDQSLSHLFRLFFSFQEVFFLQSSVLNNLVIEVTQHFSFYQHQIHHNHHENH
jgi:hypothetical protein